jgi:hypothetical protein
MNITEFSCKKCAEKYILKTINLSTLNKFNLSNKSYDKCFCPAG